MNLQKKKFERVKRLRRNRIVVYAIPIGILGLISSIALLINIPATFGEVSAIVLIVVGLSISITSIITRSSSIYLFRLGLTRKEIYGVLAVLFGWIQYWLIHLTSRLDSLYLILIDMATRLPE